MLGSLCRAPCSLNARSALKQQRVRDFILFSQRNGRSDPKVNEVRSNYQPVVLGFKPGLSGPMG
jgi:hypothetical protein